MRWEWGLPEYRPKANLHEMMFPRNTVMELAIKSMLPEYREFLQQEPLPLGSSWRPDEQAEWMASMERKYLWPLKRRGTPASGTHVVFLERLTQGRSILNLDAVRQTLTETLLARGYSIEFINPTNIPVEDQILTVSRATVLISMHGAGLTHAMWMNPRSVIIEIVAKTNGRNFFKLLAADYNLGYLELRHYRGTVSNGGDIVDYDVNVDTDQLITMVKQGIWSSDQLFHPPPDCHEPITDYEAALSGLNAQVLLDNVARLNINREEQ
jgi:hypothetical protein